MWLVNLDECFKTSEDGVDEAGKWKIGQGCEFVCQPRCRLAGKT